MSQEKKFVCIAVDMGASNIRIMAGILDGLKIEYREVHRFPNEIIEKDGHERWDIESIVTHIKNGIERVIDEYGQEVKSLGVDAWGVDFALLDSNGELVDQPVAYRDKRTEGMEEQWTGMMSRRETFERTGINFYIFNTLFQLLSFRESGLPENRSPSHQTVPASSAIRSVSPIVGKARPTIFMIGAEMRGRRMAGITNRAINPATITNRIIDVVVMVFLLLNFVEACLFSTCTRPERGIFLSGRV